MIDGWLMRRKSKVAVELHRLYRYGKYLKVPTHHQKLLDKRRCDTAEIDRLC